MVILLLGASILNEPDVEFESKNCINSLNFSHPIAFSTAEF